MFTKEEKEELVRDLGITVIQQETIDKEMCRMCGGKCCKKCGCHFSPEDFGKISYELLKLKISKGYISIGIYEYPEKGKGYFLKMRDKGSGIISNNEKTGGCVYLTPNGCKFSYKDRPKGGRMLIPGEDFCYNQYDYIDCCNDWFPYEHLIEKLIRHFKKVDYYNFHHKKFSS